MLHADVNLSAGYFLTTLIKGDFSTPLITYCEIMLSVYKNM